MKKHNEGYVLPLVLVVMVILSLIAVGVMSISLHNLQTQKAYIARMQDQYEAQGEVEKVTAELTAEISKLGSTAFGIDTAEAKVQTEIGNTASVQDGKVVVGELLWSENTDGSYTCKIPLNTTDEVGNKSVQCIVVLDSVLKPTGEGQNVLFEISKVQYEAYEIVTLPDTSETEVTGNG